MELSNEVLTRTKQKMEALTTQLHNASARLTAVSRTTEAATQAVTQAVKATRAVATLLAFDEINRLKEASASSGSSKKSSGDTDKVKTGQTALLDGDMPKLTLPDRDPWSKIWTQFHLGLQQVDDGGEAAGQSLVQRLWLGIRTAFGDVGQWVKEHLWDPISTGWGSLGGVFVTVGAVLGSTAGSLWEEFRTAWQNGGTRSVQIWNALTGTAANLWLGFKENWGTRSVQIWDSLTNTASSLWQSFKQNWGGRSVQVWNSLTNSAAGLWQSFSSGWGTRAVSVVNTLKNSAATLWEQFRSGWAGRVLGLSVSYNSNVSGFKKAVYQALGLSGWPSISFAARGGVFNSATLTMLGEAGTEAVVPLENNTGWMDVMAQKLGERMGGAGSVVVPVYIGGEKLAEAVVDAINATTRANGASPLYI